MSQVYCIFTDFSDNLLDAHARGTTGYAAVRQKQFLSIEIPLPPLDEQHRIVERVEALAIRIAKAQTLREEAEQEADALVESILNSVIQDLEKKHETKFLEELIVDANYGTSVKCFSERENGSIPVLRIPNVASEKVTLTNLKYGSLSKSEFDKTVLKQGDILVVRTNGSADLVGRCAVVPELHEPMAFASYMIRIRCNQEIVSSEYLQLVLRQQRTSGFLFDFARTSAGQYNVSLGRLKRTKFPYSHVSAPASTSCA
jgi:type I restriction enzyme S subunit